MDRHVLLLGAGRPIALTLRLGRSGYYVPTVISKYIETLAGNDPNLTVVIVNADGTYFGSADGKFVVSALKSSGHRNVFMSALESDDGNGFSEIAGVARQKIDTSTTNAEALKTMEKDNLSKLVAVSSDNQPRGLVFRD